MTGPRCELTELYVDQCAHCREKTAPADPVAEFLAGPQIVMGPWFSAGFASYCDGCGNWFEQDDQIRADGEGGWVSECCGQVDS